MLSTSYKKAAELAHKSSRAALSLILVVAAFLGFHTMTGSEPKVLVPTVTAPSNTELQIPVTTPKTSVVKSKKAVKKATTSNQADIAALNDQLAFAKVELSAQVDLLKVIMDTNVFGTESKSAAPVAAAALKAITNDGGSN